MYYGQCRGAMECILPVKLGLPLDLMTIEY